MATLNPYLIFDGKTEEAFNFYRSVFGGEFGGVMRYRETPEAEKVSPAHLDKIIHISLPVGDSVLMGSDPPDHWKGEHTPGNNFNISYSATSEADVNEKFEALSAGGTAYMQPAKTFWGSYFAMVKDRFGVQWMLGYDYK